jgi:glycosyltransferase involved in cell wall biosynthesis
MKPAVDSAPPGPSTVARAGRVLAHTVWSYPPRALGPKPDFTVIAHRLDESGAPLVLAGVLEDLVARHGPASVRLVAQDVVPSLQGRLRQLGVAVEPQFTRLPEWLVRLQLALRRDTLVVLNTSAVYENYAATVLRLLARGQVDRVLWFVHEYPDGLPRWFARFHETMRVLVEQDRLVLLVPSTKAKRAYDALFETTKTAIVRLRVAVDPRYCAPRSAEFYSTLRFVLIGGARGGRKGHLQALAAFEALLARRGDAVADGYRDFGVRFIGLEDDDELADAVAIRRRGSEVLGARLEVFPPQTHERTVALASECNVVISCSATEVFSLAVAEGMAMGQVVLRNDTGGREEQLAEGVNGRLLADGDVLAFADVLDDLLSTRSTSDAALQAMGAASQAMIAEYARASYAEQFARIVAASDACRRGGGPGASSL